MVLTLGVIWLWKDRSRKSYILLKHWRRVCTLTAISSIRIYPVVTVAVRGCSLLCVEREEHPYSKTLDFVPFSQGLYTVKTEWRPKEWRQHKIVIQSCFLILSELSLKAWSYRCLGLSAASVDGSYLLG